MIFSVSHRASLSAETFRRTDTIDNLRDQGAGTSYLEGQNGIDEKTSEIVWYLDMTIALPRPMLA